MCERFNGPGFSGIVCLGGPERMIDVRGRRWHFEMHRIFGPCPISPKKKSEIRAPQAFYEAVTWWIHQGQRVDERGLCVWELPPKVPVYRLAPRHYTEDATMAAKFGVTEPAYYRDPEIPLPKDLSQ